MPRKSGYRHISIQVTSEEYQSIERAADNELTDFIRSMLIKHVPNFPDNMPKRGKYERKQKAG